MARTGECSKWWQGRTAGMLVAGVALAGLGLLALVPPAEARPSTRSMTCQQAANMVARSGGIVMNTSPTTFDRYVSDLRSCMVGESLKPAFEPTRDNPQCFIGYTCFMQDRFGRDW
ncbi:hypothetical protein ACLBXM_12135 [Xanthobacteraceae bacterium A53D]